MPHLWPKYNLDALFCRVELKGDFYPTAKVAYITTLHQMRTHLCNVHHVYSSKSFWRVLWGGQFWALWLGTIPQWHTLLIYNGSRVCVSIKFFRPLGVILAFIRVLVSVPLTSIKAAFEVSSVADFYPTFKVALLQELRVSFEIGPIWWPCLIPLWTSLWWRIYPIWNAMRFIVYINGDLKDMDRITLMH